MGALLKATLPVVLIAGALSGLAGYAYGVHSWHRRTGTPVQSAAPAPSQRFAGDDILVPPPSWTRWPSLTDF
jgi:hypothetical protein